MAAAAAAAAAELAARRGAVDCGIRWRQLSSLISNASAGLRPAVSRHARCLRLSHAQLPYTSFAISSAGKRRVPKCATQPCPRILPASSVITQNIIPCTSSVRLRYGGAEWYVYGTNVCPMNSADRHSLQFTINKIVYKIFGAVSKDLYIEINAHFGIESVENSVASRRNRFINRYGETDNYLCQLLR